MFSLSFVFLWFAIDSRPFTSNRMEIYNEASVYLGSMLIMAFLNSSANTQATVDGVGWVYVGLVAINILSNIGISLFETLKLLIKSIRLHRRNKRLQKQNERLLDPERRQ